MSDYIIRIEGLEALTGRLGQADAMVEAELRAAMHQATQLVERAAQAEAPRDTGLLMRSIVSEVTAHGGGIRGEVGVLHGPATAYARPVEFGRRAGAAPPPSRAIAGRLRRHGGDPALAYVVARSIGRRGIRARPFLGTALDRRRGQVLRIFAEARDRIIGRLAGKGAA